MYLDSYIKLRFIEFRKNRRWQLARPADAGGTQTVLVIFIQVNSVDPNEICHIHCLFAKNPIFSIYLIKMIIAVVFM